MTQEDVVLTVEYSVRGAMHAVYSGSASTCPSRPVHHALAEPATALRALRTAFG
ncbi:oleate hydratase [Kitasatospora sp. NBC_01246]|uniref:hypothetical protein n=1 Tax=Kitasatospora sp. NBC_01246 TaxID=2903570 RepID=UPI002E3799B2|nr:hypothetical protein [Kitasatospora sp. NBC_01246]